MLARQFALIIFICALAMGQQPWTGVLHDAHGDPISGARVRLQSGSNRATASTAQDGRFQFTSLPAGEYSLAVEHNGVTATLSRPVSVPGDGSPVVLELSASGTLSLVEAAHETTGGEKLSSKAVSELPLNKRDFSQLLLLAAGTMTDTNGASNFTQQFAVNGQRGTAAVFAMDGADSTDPEMGGTTFSNFNVDAVQEIRSSSGVMPAEIGRGAAGFTDIITRSGTDAIHGSAFEFLRNAALDARNFFDRRSLAEPGRIPPFIRNEFGFTNGGPLTIPGLYHSRGRTYYFVEYQGFRQVFSNTVVIPVPTAAERAGKDTTAFPGDTLTVPVDPAIAKLLNRYPMPNDAQGPFGARTYAAASKVTTFSDQFSVRIDHAISDKTKLFGRFTMENTNGPTTNPSQTAIDPSFAVEFVDLQRNAVVTLTRTPSPNFITESSISFTRATPGFPSLNRTDPSLLFGDSLYEPFNAAGGGVMAEFGNLFQIRQNFTWIRGRHTFKAGGEVRGNRDTTWFGTGPNGQYQFGGGVAYSPVEIRSASGAHDIHVGDPLPDALSGLLSGSAFTYSVGVAPLIFSQGAHIGDSAIHRDAYNVYLQDSWKVSARLLLNVGLRYEINSQIRETAKRTSDPVLTPLDGALPGTQFLINPQPPYKLDKNGWGPHLGVEWRVTDRTRLHAGGAITTLLTNLWQDNFLTGSTPFVVYPRLTAAQGQLVPFGTTITPQQLPVVYSTSGVPIFASGDSKQVPGNTLMDILRFERDLAALSPDHQITPLVVAGISPSFRDGYIGTWTAGVEQKLGGVTVDTTYVGTAGIRLPVMDSPNGYPGAAPAFAPYTQFDSSGQVAGGYGQVMLLTNRSHSTYHALQVSAQNNLTASGLGFQASYTFSKSLDDTSGVLGGSMSQNPFHPQADKGPSNFDVRSALSFSLFQDLHADRLALLRPLGKTLTGGWQLLSIGSYMTGLPFTVFSGVQQTGVGSAAADRPDQIGTPDFSTSRTVREDYFGRGADNASFFSVPHGRFGTLGRNTFRGPAFRNLDIALIKDTPIGRRAAGGELASLQFRAEFFNIFNIVNFGLPSNTVLGPGFGEISRTAGTSRQIQFSLKLIY
ncbi:MAG: TonB-dependent receptor [Bryobacteraceae bacterium]